ncbi:unnamed protein product [Prorocentrum cordatum]|uniref:Transmembrane protein n=1 Tax=Prorocentrum cordatum TaxID=2364126 RepID=A0ABN9R1D5_9DINO|nr:unnamed protein product [Polarella glacialis]
MAAPPPPGLGRALTQTLAESLVGECSAEPTGTSAADQGSTEPLQPSAAGRTRTTAALEREAYQDRNQRRLAAEILRGRAALFTCFLVLLGLALFVFTCVIYCLGYRVYFDSGSKPCDEPLGAWLLVVILAFPVRVCLTIVYRSLRIRAADEEVHTPLTKGIHGFGGGSCIFGTCSAAPCSSRWGTTG